MWAADINPSSQPVFALSVVPLPNVQSEHTGLKTKEDN